jgi:hypothetical protein
MSIDAYNDSQVERQERRFLEPKPDKCLYGFYIDDRVAVIKRNFSDFGFEGVILGFDEGVLKVEIEGDTMKWVDWLPPQDLIKI